METWISKFTNVHNNFPLSKEGKYELLNFAVVAFEQLGLLETKSEMMRRFRLGRIQAKLLIIWQMNTGRLQKIGNRRRLDGV